MSKKIIRLTAENVKRLKTVCIEPSGNIVAIGGKNGQGKTSTLDAISMALGGGNELCKRPIRDGEETAKIELDLGDLLVTRRFTAKKSYLEVSTKDGANYSSPQAVLDKLTGKISFDPLSFCRLDAKKQLDTLRRMVGVDLSGVDAERDGIFGDRTAVNRNGKAMRARFEGAAHHEGAPEEEIVITELSRKLKRADENNSAADEADRVAAAHADTLMMHSEQLDRIEEQIVELQADLDAATKKIPKLQANATETAQRAKDLERIDMAPLYDAIDEAENVNTRVRDNKRKESLGLELKDLRDESDKLTEQLKVIDAKKARMLADAKFPVDGLSFDTDGVTYKTIPFDQCSGAEQLRLSAAIGLAMNPGLRVLLIRDGAVLDSESMELLSNFADKNDAQIWIERVGEGAECSVIIEDGQVK